MLSRSVNTSAKRQAKVYDLSYVPPRPSIPAERLFPRLVSAMCLGLLLLVLGVMGLARLFPLPQIIDLPLAYLPGSPLPEGLSCHVQDYELMPRCRAEVAEHEVYFVYDPASGIIQHSVVPAQQYRLGQLILSWGRPTGMHHTDLTGYIFWTNRAALIYGSDIQPDTQVDFILYETEQRPVSPWRGFRRELRQSTSQSD